jgi:hypothetical protein
MQEGGHQAQIAGYRGLESEQRKDALVDLEEAAVDAIVIGNHHLSKLDILVLECLEHSIELLDDQVQAPHRAQLELPQLPLEVGARIVMERPSSEVWLPEPGAGAAIRPRASPAAGST